MQLRVSPLAVVPSSVFAQLSSLTQSLNLGSIDSSVGDASLALDQTVVNGSLGSANLYGRSDASSTPVVVNVKAVATLLGVLQNELNSLPLGVGNTVSSTLQQQLTTLEQTLTSTSPALAPYLNAVNDLTTSGSFALKTAEAHYPAGPLFDPETVVPADPTGLIYQAKALAPYTAAASDGDATAKHTVEATSSLDALNLLDLGNLPISVNSLALTQLNTLINEIETALEAADPSLSSTLSGVTGTVSGTLSSTLGTLAGVVGSTPVSNVIPAGTDLSTLGTLLTQLLNLKADLSALPTSIDLSSIVATKEVASDVTTTVTNGVVDSVATTKAADIKLLTVNAPQLTQALGVAQGNAVAEIIGATATAEAKADGKTSTATGSGQFTDIKLLPGSALASSLPNGGDISFQYLTSLAGCAGAGSTCTVNAGPLRLQILTGACACIDQAHGGTADAASAQVAALEIKLSYIGDPNLLLGPTAVGALTSPQGTAIPLADVSLANVTANAGNQVHVLSAETGSPYGTGLLVGFLMLVGALGLGVTYRRFAAVKVRS